MRHGRDDEAWRRAEEAWPMSRADEQWDDEAWPMSRADGQWPMTDEEWPMADEAPSMGEECWFEDDGASSAIVCVESPMPQEQWPMVDESWQMADQAPPMGEECWLEDDLTSPAPALVCVESREESSVW